MSHVYPTKEHPLIGLAGGAVFWYTAHELGFYFSDFNCLHSWILPLIHVLMLAGSIFCTWLSRKFWPRDVSYPDAQRRAINAGIGFFAGALFSLVIFWQLIATLIYNGCER